ncbi:3-dehydroquinate synthase [Ekhidna sp.]|uniref:3-dehydroquinate synthase n=1 Tax=Ekhidna sp. TaxID=2608089 RepID=UPI003BAB0B35
MSENLPTYLSISTNISSDLIATIKRINPDKIGILVDENTRKHCLHLIDINYDAIIEIGSGEVNKTLETCSHIWDELTTAGFTRQSVLLNLGGGVIGDMGGFVAATFKRGMAFINIPTTLLSQVDASIGGKLGIDFKGLKNHIGLFQEPDKVLVDPTFLNTLPQRELKSGFAEIIKHALIQDPLQWEYLLSKEFKTLDWNEIIPKSIAIKNKVVQEDPKEKGKRKILNYGHTIGHALETYFLTTSNPLLHGEAVALGMILENQIAVEMEILKPEINKVVEEYIRKIYDLPSEWPAYKLIEKFLTQDKKNDKEGFRLSLLSKIGSCTYDVLISDTILKKVLDK